MAGDWIKMRGNLWDDPRVAALVDATETSEAAVIGGLYWLWATADQHTEDGLMPGLTLRQIDRKTGVPGLGKALCDIGWLAEKPEGVCLENFTEHNGASAKRRASEAQRKANSRNLSASDADKARTNNGQIQDEIRQVAELEKEKRREELIQEDKSSLSASPPEMGQLSLDASGDEAQKPSDGPPACPYDRILDAYEAALPNLPQIRRSLFLKGKNAKALRSRWVWVMRAKHESGERAGARLATTIDEGVQWFGRYFDYVSRSDFLTGRSGRFTSCDMGWLVNSDNFEKVLSGKYHHEIQEGDHAA